MAGGIDLELNSTPLFDRRCRRKRMGRRALKSTAFKPQSHFEYIQISRQLHNENIRKACTGDLNRYAENRPDSTG